MRLTPGTTVHLECEFTVDGVLTDPSTVECRIRRPSGAVESFSYVGGVVDRVAQGRYQLPLEVDDEGAWEWRWIGAGACAATDQGYFTVRAALAS